MLKAGLLPSGSSPFCQMKEVSFLKRRKILRKLSALDLHPLKLMESEPREQECVNILLPRFRNSTLSKLFQPSWKEKFIRIKLDPFGSAVWNLIDGRLSAGEIGERLTEMFPGRFDANEDTQERVSRFLSLLYQQRFISFSEISAGGSATG